MSFKKFKKWCKRHKDDIFYKAYCEIIFDRIIDYINYIPFWKRGKEWKMIYNSAIKSMIDCVERIHDINSTKYSS